jgi:hypothetical protein
MLRGVMGHQKPMHAWRASLPQQGEEIFVVDCGPSAERVVSGLAPELDDEPWRDSHDYVLIDARGNIKDKFTVTTWSIEEELGASVFAVIGRALRNLSVSVFFADPVRVKRAEKTVVDGLQPVAADDHETLSFLTTALAHDQQVRAGQQEVRGRAGDARIAAIPGAVDDHAIGDDFRLAQELLAAQVKASNAEIDGAMLHALARFGSLYNSIRTVAGSDDTALAALAAAVGAFVIACRLVASDQSLGKNDPDPVLEQHAGAFATLPTTIQVELHELTNVLDGLKRDLEKSAEWKEWSDARFAAIAMRAAAAHAARACEHLANGFASVK